MNMPALFLGVGLLGAGLFLSRKGGSLGYVWPDDIEECEKLALSLRPKCPELFRCRNQMREAVKAYMGPPGKQARDALTRLTQAIRQNPDCHE
jgi:hypothetical protein